MNSIPNHPYSGARAGAGLQQALGATANLGALALSAFPTMATGGIAPAAGGLAATLGGGLLGGAGEFGNLLALMQQQVSAQQTMQVFTTQSNLAKTMHDARMAAVRNMRP